MNGRILFVATTHYSLLITFYFLETPFDAKARTDSPTLSGTGEVVGDFDLTTDVEVVASEEAAHLIPQLGLSEEGGVGSLTNIPGNILPPEIGKAREGKARNTKEVVKTPNSGELQRHIAVAATNIFVHDFERQTLAEIVVGDEILNTIQPGVVDGITTPTQRFRIIDAATAVPLNMEADIVDEVVAHAGVLAPEIDATGNLRIEIGRSDVVGVINIGEEESGTPIVALEHFKSGGEMTTVEVIHFLDVGLSLGSDNSKQHSCNKYYFFHNTDNLLIKNLFVIN